MFERLMTDQRSRVVGVLIGLLAISVLLWFIRGPEFDLSNVLFFTVSLLLVPLFYIAVYGVAYVVVQVNKVPARVFRAACAVLFGAAGAVLAGSALLAVYDFATHRSLPTPSLAALGVALGAMKAFGLESMAAVPQGRGVSRAQQPFERGDDGNEQN